ncbi:hypothetical protein Hamer_G024850 [Homarus americanus]|uniref:Uncharacterized protein n=1 Tax=Homarus americanus TaxID=6706 RepID=A0A8J5MKQ8_HOMAM|nr:hypothetical protein Hamer_G024850 [Homarus americanus]
MVKSEVVWVIGVGHGCVGHSVGRVGHGCRLWIMGVGKECQRRSN